MSDIAASIFSSSILKGIGQQAHAELTGSNGAPAVDPNSAQGQRDLLEDYAGYMAQNPGVFAETFGDYEKAAGVDPTAVDNFVNTYITQPQNFAADPVPGISIGTASSGSGT